MLKDEDAEKRHRALQKIKKCFSLAKSSNAHEAEAAIRQAHKLMDKFKFEMGDVDASQAEEFSVKIGKAKSKPARWCRMLSATVAAAFGCITLTASGTAGQHLIFIGDTGTAEMAAYAYEVLARQLKVQRKQYVLEFGFTSASQKRRLADVYAESWVGAVAKRVEEFAGVSEEVERAINAYMDKNHPHVPLGKFKRRVLSRHEHHAFLQGNEDGEAASLHKPMGMDQRAQLEAVS